MVGLCIVFAVDKSPVDGSLASAAGRSSVGSDLPHRPPSRPPSATATQPTSVSMPESPSKALSVVEQTPSDVSDRVAPSPSALSSSMMTSSSVSKTSSGQESGVAGE